MINKKEFGDFQTPLSLARRVVALIKADVNSVGTIVEPTCGVGAFLQAAAELFGESPYYWGFDINVDHVEAARANISKIGLPKITIEQRDFYGINWSQFLGEQSGPLLLIGNPPWITNSGMGAIQGSNLPEKSNFQKHSGFSAKTGKANFDISEWMLVKLLETLRGRPAAIAMLCKTATARKVLRQAWVKELGVGPSSLHLIDATAEFGVSVDACLFYTHTGTGATESIATVYRTLSFDDPMQTFGLFSGELVSDIDAYRTSCDLTGLQHRKWRSGVKHDAAKVMEFTRDKGSFVNGLGERCDLENDYIFPLLKSSDLANGRLMPTRYVLLTQCRINDSIDEIKCRAPKTWRYLLDHSQQMDERRSSIYAKRPRFAIFGIGDYSFSPAKVAISGLYKNLRFQAVGSVGDRPVMVDDTCYFIPCNSLFEAEFFASLLNSNTAQQFISALVFSDSKRPVTIDVLKRIDLKKLAEYVEQAATADDYLSLPLLTWSRPSARPGYSIRHDALGNLQQIARGVG
ncbi:hypothetical protein JKG47_11850 [Acidithiobacillus sp. MC6.1]|nr:hypothetical protein [Acidithiobacillus sp. MC6.1]